MKLVTAAPYDAREAAGVLRLHPRTVTRFALAGLFPAGVAFTTPGGAWRFHRAGLAAIVTGELEFRGAR